MNYSKLGNQWKKNNWQVILEEEFRDNDFYMAKP